MNESNSDPLFKEPLKIIEVQIVGQTIIMTLNHEVPYAWKVAYFKYLPSLAPEYYPARARFNGSHVEMNVPDGNHGIAAHQFQSCMKIATLSYLAYVLNSQINDIELHSQAHSERVSELKAKEILTSLNGELKPRILQGGEDNKLTE